MRVGISTIAYTQPEALLAMAESAVRTVHEIQFHLFLHSKIKRVENACDKMRDGYNVVYYPLKRNAGVAKSWNSGLLSMMEHNCDTLMLVNDDIVFSEGDIDTMVEMSLSNPDAWAVFCSVWNI